MTTGGRRVSGVEEDKCQINGDGKNKGEKEKKLNISFESLNKTFFSMLTGLVALELLMVKRATIA